MLNISNEQSQIQSAILPEAGPFALYVQLKVNANAANVLAELQKLPNLIAELNQTQPDAYLTASVAFSKAFWDKFEQAAPSDLIDFPALGEGDRAHCLMFLFTVIQIDMICTSLSYANYYLKSLRTLKSLMKPTVTASSILVI